MTATYTDNLRLTRQGDNDNPNTWGQVLNNQVIALLEEAISGVSAVNITGTGNIDISSTTVNGGTDVARHAVLELTGTLGANIELILPAVEKMYLIRAAYTGAYTVSVKPTGGGTSIPFTTGKTGIIYTNGTSIYEYGNSDALLASNNLSDLDDASDARDNLGLGTAAVLDVGTDANDVVQLDGTGRLPAVDGSQLTGLFSGGTMAAQNANNVAITGGTITGITDLAIADGGTGASDAATARSNLGLGTMSTQNSNNVNITGGTINGVFTGLTLEDVNTGGISGIRIRMGSIQAYLFSAGSASNDWSTITYPTAFSSAPTRHSTGITGSMNEQNVTNTGFQYRSGVAPTTSRIFYIIVGSV